MKINKNTVFFEDTDSVEQIKEFYTVLNEKEKLVENRKYGTSTLEKTNLSLSEIIKQIESFNFNNLKQEEISHITTLLKKEEQNLNNDFQDLFNTKLTAGISLIDYLTRNNEQLPHEFKYSKEENFHIGNFTGELKNELHAIEGVLGSNPISFYTDIKDNKKLPYLNFSQPFAQNIKTIKKHFIADIEEKEFNNIVKNYLEFKDSLLNLNIKKVKHIF